MDGVVAGVVKFLGAEGAEGVLGCEFGLSATFSPSGPRGVKPVAGVGDDEFSLHFCQDGGHPEHGSAFCCGGVDALLKHAQTDAAFLEGSAEGDQVQRGSAKAVEAGDDELVTTPVGRSEGFVEFGAGCIGPLARSR